MDHSKAGIQSIRPSNEIFWREVNGELVAVHNVTGEYHVFNPTGKHIWYGIVEGKDTQAIAESIVDYYEATYEAALVDSEKFLAALREWGLLEKISRETILEE